MKNNPKPESKNFPFDRRLDYAAVGLVFLGQAMQHCYSIPRFVRWHFTNVFDVIPAAYVIDALQMRYFGHGSRPIASALLALAGGTAHEIEQAVTSGKGFDWTDEICYAFGACAYVALCRWSAKRNEPIRHADESARISAPTISP